MIEPVVDEIFIEGLRVDSLIGVYDGEREGTQPLLFDVRLRFDSAASAASDALGDTIDYASVVATLHQFVQASANQLLEKLAAECCRFLADSFRPTRIELKIDKPYAAQALGCQHVGVRLVRDYPDRQQCWLLLLGSNLDTPQSLHRAIAAMDRIGSAQMIGAVQHLPPNQGKGVWYYNVLVSLRSTLSATALADELNRIEHALGRDREDTERVSIDIDMLAKRASEWVADPHAQASGKLEHRATLKLLADNAVQVWRLHTA